MPKPCRRQATCDPSVDWCIALGVIGALGKLGANRTIGFALPAVHHRLYMFESVDSTTPHNWMISCRKAIKHTEHIYDTTK